MSISETVKSFYYTFQIGKYTNICFILGWFSFCTWVKWNSEILHLHKHKYQVHSKWNKCVALDVTVDVSHWLSLCLHLSVWMSLSDVKYFFYKDIKKVESMQWGVLAEICGGENGRDFHPGEKQLHSPKFSEVWRSICTGNRIKCSCHCCSGSIEPNSTEASLPMV